MRKEDLIRYIDDVPNFPEKGILFKDISPLLANGEVLSFTIDEMAKMAKDADVIVGPDARGFLFGTPTAAKLKKPFVMVRKKKKLPGKVIRKEYNLEYGSNTLEMQEGRIKPGEKVVIIDDVLATGGTTSAIIDLITLQKAKVIKVIFLLELANLKGREKFKNYDIQVESLIKI